jgi:lysine biosynthesis protein LysW
MATCPECDAEISVLDDDIEEMEVGDPWDCDACGSRLRVAILDPLEFETDDEEDEDESEPAVVSADGDAADLDEDDDEDGDADEDGEGGDWDE